MRAVILVSLAGCSGPVKGFDTADTAAFDGTATGTEYEDSDVAPETPGVAPAWWTVQGVLVVAGGVVDPTLSTLDVLLYDAGEALLCTASGAPVSVADAALPDPGLLTWWDVTTAPSTADCAPPATFQLGIGPYDTDLDPAAYAAGVPTSGLNGLYTRSGDALWVFGVAGTAAQFAEEAPPIAAAPLEDGEVRLAGLVLLPI